MRRSDDHAPFDHELDDAPDLTTEFWGDAAWPSRRRSRSGATSGHRAVEASDATAAADTTTTTTMRAIRDGVAAFRPQRVELRDGTGQIRRTRAHGAARSGHDAVVAGRAEASIGDLAAGRFDDPFSDDPFVDDPFFDDPIAAHPSADHDTMPPARRRATGSAIDVDGIVPVVARPRPNVGVDPLLARLGVMLLIGVLLVPVALALRPADPAPDSVQIEAPTGVSAAAGDVPAAQPSTAPSVASAAAEAGAPAGEARSAPAPADAAPAQDTASAPEAAGTASDGAAEAESATDAVTESVTETSQNGGENGEQDGGLTEAASVDAEAERVVPECPQTYTAAPGDSWYRIADAAGVTPDALLVENRATVDTVILPGDDICLPRGATMPSPPTTVPATTAPATTAPAGTQPVTTTTAPPTTTPPGSPGRNASVDEVKDVIRSIFPESEWETAFVIADRESRFEPTAYNGWCCYGVFQIYWTVHRGWLDDLGIDSSDDLFDPLLNVRAAYEIWQRAGNSWSPWSTYDG